MQRYVISISLYIIINCVASLVGAGTASAFWVWTPETGKFINPKNAPKESPEAQLEWALTFFEQQDYEATIDECKKLVKHYPLSRKAADAQYYIGVCQEELGKPYKAFLAYQGVLDRYPYTDRINELIERQYRIGNLFYTGRKRKVLGFEILPAMDKAVEVFEKVVENAPYGAYGELAQFKLGLTYKKIQDYTSARAAFETLVQEYPNSALIDDARYQIAYCTVKTMNTADYDQVPTREALQEFRKFVTLHPESEMAGEADQTITALREQQASKEFNIALYYEERGNEASAIVYYRSIVDEFPGTQVATRAMERLVELRKEDGK